MKRRHSGESLWEVLCAMTLLAIVFLTLSQLHAKSWRMQRDLAHRLTAAALLEAWAEWQRASVSHASAAPRAVAAAWTAEAAQRLPAGAMDFRSMGQGVARARVRWASARNLAQAHGGNEGGPSVIAAPNCADLAPGTRCLVLYVAGNLHD